jgi:integrase
MAKQPTPLYLHASGQWAKKVHGKLIYFGTDLTAANARWLAERDYWIAGVTPPTRMPTTEAATLSELANLFNDRCKRLVRDDEMSQRSFDDYTPTLKRLIAILGSTRQVETLTPLDFANIKERLGEPIARAKNKTGRTCDRRSPGTIAGDIRRIRAFLSWCHDSRLIAEPDYGSDFAPIARKTAQRHAAKKERRDLSPDDLRAIIAASSIGFRPLILLAINGGVGNLDLAEMRITQLPNLGDADPWLILPRGKTGTDRRFPLWPETVAAIRDYLPNRPAHAGRSNADRLFLTRHGLAWIRADGGKRVDSIAGAFTKCRKAAGIPRGTFYDLRRTFQTIAAETLDFPAVSFVMGHAKRENDMAARYTQHIADERIRAVCERVRGWLDIR